MNGFLLSVVAFVFAIGLLVAVHEWGHYIVARLAGVRVIRFSIGFGKPLWMWRGSKDDTEYCISAIPLGGYVHLLDERREDVDPSESHRAFNQKSVSARIAILVAGPAMNFIFAVLAYWMMFVTGAPGVQPIVGEIEPDSPAEAAGLLYGDTILAVGDQQVVTWQATVLELLDQLLDGEPIALRVSGEDGRERSLQLDVGDNIRELTEPGALFAGLGLGRWTPPLESVVGEVVPGESAARAGIQSGDRLLRADGVDVTDWQTFVGYISVRPDQPIELTINRDGQILDIPVSLGSIVGADGEPAGRIGLGPVFPENLYADYEAEQRYGPMRALAVAAEKTWDMSVLTVRMVSRMFTGDVSVKNISGPINIATYAGYSASIGIESFLGFLAIVSLSLGILNLLPIPVLDGGQIVFQLVEAVKGSPVSDKALLVGQQIGILLLVLVMSVAFYNDITRLFS